MNGSRPNYILGSSIIWLGSVFHPTCIMHLDLISSLATVAGAFFKDSLGENHGGNLVSNGYPGNRGTFWVQKNLVSVKG